jgi:hypothetical protein
VWQPEHLSLNSFAPLTTSLLAFWSRSISWVPQALSAAQARRAGTSLEACLSDGRAMSDASL